MLERYFRQRGIAMLDTEGGGSTPAHFGNAAGEHLATRRGAGLFDFSFIGCWELTGPGCVAFLSRLQTRNIHRLRPGRVYYTLLCRDDGTVLNDATLWRLGTDRFWLFTGNRYDVTHLMTHARGHDMVLRELTCGIAVIALQGPASRDMLAPLMSPGALDGLGYFGFREARVCGQPAHLARLGYSGELGYELVLSSTHAADTWEALLSHGKPQGLQECGFDAANSLRIESGYILFSRELSLAVTPWQLGLGRLVDRAWAGPIDARAWRQSRRAPASQLVGLRLQPDRFFIQEPRHPVARVTSRAWSPLLSCELALGFVNADDARAGQAVQTQSGQRASVHRLPFYDPSRSRPRVAMSNG